ncbi:MAG: site-specific integrase [Sphingomonas adhaesiva]|uniref:tyrosine-type recombinase/integrase n=1 Tax=Sphingomonas adhaesiva TaxID=28212 RepID=UPI002FF630C6
MPTAKITKRAVDAATATDRDHFLWDTEVPGFGLKVTPKGARSYVVQYRMGGRETNPTRYTIGKHGVWTPDLAREEARRLLRLADQGADPREAERRRRREAVELAFGSYAELFTNLYLKPNWKAWEDGKRHLDLHCTPVLKGKPISTIRKQDVAAIIDKLADRPATAKNVFATLRKLFNWAVNRGDIDASPLTGMDTPAGVKPRQRVLSRDELAAVWIAAGRIDDRHGSVTRLLILNGQRLEEDAAMEWTELDVAARQWNLPGPRTKNGLPHIVPLGPQSVEIVERQTRGKSVFVFAGSRGGSPGNWTAAKEKLDAIVLTLMQEQAERQGNDPAQVVVPRWTLHDLRRTVATEMPAIGVSAEVVEAVLNHISGAKSGVAGVYNRYAYLPEKTDALNRWDAHLKYLVRAFVGREGE